MLYPANVSSNNPKGTSNDKHKDNQNQRRPFPWLATLPLWWDLRPAASVSSRSLAERPTFGPTSAICVSLALLAVLGTCRFGSCGCPGWWPRDPRIWGSSITEPRGREREVGHPSPADRRLLQQVVRLAGEEEMGIRGEKKHPTRYLSSHGKAF